MGEARIYRSSRILNMPKYRSLQGEILRIYRSFAISLELFEVSHVRILLGQQKFVPLHQSSFLI